MHADEARDAGALLGTALAEVAELTHDVHRAVSARLFALLGARARPVQLAHDGIAALAYGSTRIGVLAVPAALGVVAAALNTSAGPSVHDVARGRFALHALNGFWGDRLETHRVALATPLRIRTEGGRLRRLPANVAYDAATSATGRLIVFIHGLCENDCSWSWGAHKHWGEVGVTFGSLLHDTDGWTPLYVSYNSGRHVWANGAEMAEQLDVLVAQWPVPVTEVALVGHSMGGLVARSAAHQAAASDLAWVAKLRHVVGLGAPHHGAPLERAVGQGARAMAKLPETAPFATWLNRRSVGIKDLRHGAFIEQDWAGVDPDGCLDDRRTASEFLHGVHYYAVSATLSRAPRGPLAHDLLVQHSSACGAHPIRPLRFEAHRTLHLGGRHHFDLLSDPLVYERLRTWLAGDPGQAQDDLGRRRTVTQKADCGVHG
jgi:pimeloyl-ACP methyl ester carboxylesterase